MALTKVTSNVIADDAITSAMIAPGAIDDTHITGITTTDIAEGTNQYYTDGKVGTYLNVNGYDTATNIISAITDTAPITLDTLNELAAALGDDPNFATTTATSLGLKAPLASPTFTGTVTADGLNVDGIPTATGDARYEVVISEDQTASAGRGGGIAFARQGDILGGIKNTLDATASNSQMSFQTRLSGTVATKMTLDASGNVGIGTDNPIYKLHVNSGTIGVNSGYNQGNFGMFVQGLGAGVADARALHVRGFGGHTTIGGTGPTIVLQNADGTTGNITKLSFETASNGEAVSINCINTDHGNFYGDMAFNTRGSLGYSEKLRIMANGNVGIGTSAPAVNLHVSTTSSHSEIRVSTAASGNGTVPAVSLNNTAVEWGMGILADNHLHFRENTASYQSRLTIADGGNVGIGSTNPTAPLEVFSGEIATGANKGIRLVNNGASKMYSIRTGIVGVDNTSFAIHDDTASTNRLVISSAGNVGIGTSPDGANGRLQVTGGISTTGNSEIRQSTNSDGSTLKIIATNVVVGHTNSIGYSYGGGGLLAAVSTSGSATVLDAGAYNTSTGHRLKIINDGSGISGSLEYLAGATPLLKVVSSSGTVLVGHNTGNTGARFEVRGNQTSHINAMASGNASIVGSGIPGQIAEGVLALPAGSLGTQVTIPVYSQSNLWRQYVVEIWVSTAEYNFSTNRGGTWKGQFGSLTYINGLATLEGPTGNISSVTASGSNLLVNFTAGYIGGLANYEGVYLYYKVLGGAPSFFQAWNATLN